MTIQTGMRVRLRTLPRDDAQALRRLRLGWHYTVRSTRIEYETLFISLIGVKGEYEAAWFEACGCSGFSYD